MDFTLTPFTIARARDREHRRNQYQSLRAKGAFAKEIAERGPWVCQQLQDLAICFRVGELEEHLQLQQLVFQRFSTLIRLERLEMRIPIEMIATKVCWSFEWIVDWGNWHVYRSELLSHFHV
jgi:hypothetical protein